MAENAHGGHRKRMLGKYDKSPFDSFSDHEVLEMILFYVIPQRNTNDIAHQLLREFGSLKNVLSAPPERLMRTNNIGPAAARYLSLWGKTFDRMNERIKKSPEKLTRNNLKRYFKKLFKDEIHEAFYIICLDSDDVVLGYRRLSEGSFESVDIDPAKAVRAALDYGSPQVVFAHNHPSGIDEASNADIQVTKLLNDAMRFMGIHMRDHIIFTGEKCVSIVDKYDLHKDIRFKSKGKRR